MLQFKLSIQHRAFHIVIRIHLQLSIVQMQSVCLIYFLFVKNYAELSCCTLMMEALRNHDLLSRGIEGKNESKIVDWTTSNRINAIYFEQSNSIDSSANTSIVFEGKTSVFHAILSPSHFISLEIYTRIRLVSIWRIFCAYSKQIHSLNGFLIWINIALPVSRHAFAIQIFHSTSPTSSERYICKMSFYWYWNIQHPSGTEDICHIMFINNITKMREFQLQSILN